MLFRSGQWAAEAGPEVLAVLGAARGPAEESTFRRAFTLASADVLDQVLGAWLWTRAVQAGGRLVIAVDGKTIRGAKTKAGKAPHLVAALAHGIGAVLGQVAADKTAARTSPQPTATTPATPSGHSSYFKLHEYDFAGSLGPARGHRFRRLKPARDRALCTSPKIGRAHV